MSTTHTDALGPPPSYDSVMQGDAYHGASPQSSYQPSLPYAQGPGYGTQPYSPPNIGFTPYGAPPQQTVQPIVVTTQTPHVQTYPTTVIVAAGVTELLRRLIPKHIVSGSVLLHGTLGKCVIYYRALGQSKPCEWI